MNCDHVACHIVALSGHDGGPICLGDLHGLVYVGNTLNGVYDLEKNYTLLSEHTIGLTDYELDDLAEVYVERGWSAFNEQFNDYFRDAVLERLL